MRRSLGLLLLALLVWGSGSIPLGAQEEPAGRAPAAEEGVEGERAEEDGAVADAARTKPSRCIECHGGIGGESAEIVKNFLGSVHRELDFDCSDCHGGNPQGATIYEAMDPEQGFIGKPDRAMIIQVCDRCHGDQQFMKRFGNLRTDQLELYKTSVHGQALFERGDTNVAVCTDCHAGHNILRVNNPESSVHKKNLPATCATCHSDEALMAQYGLDATIPQQYERSEHGKRLFEHDDIAAPVCNDCHGNHGAIPPGVGHIEDVCGSCHLKTEKYYNNSAHAPAFEALGLNKCLVCHNHHALQKPTDDYFDPNATANCVMCHDEASEQYGQIVAMHGTIVDIREMHENADALVEETERTTHMSMHEMIPRVEQIRTHLLTARILQHSASLADMEENLASAREEFAEIEQFTLRLLERSRFNKLMVVVLAALLFCYGIFLVFYRRLVLDKRYPWQEYEGPPLKGETADR